MVELQSVDQILPQEMLMKIFSLLSLADLSNVLLVCRHWRMVAESPWLWRRMEIVVGQMKVTNMNLLNTTRLKSVKRVRLLSRYHPDEEEAEAVFGAILEHEGIRELNISQNQINKVNSDTLARAVNSMEQVNLFNAKLSQSQVSAIYQQMSMTTKLRLVSMGCVDISCVNPDIVAPALNKLNIARLCNTNITTQQLDAILRLMSLHRTSLQEIDLGHNNLSNVNTDILAHGVNMIQVVKLYDTNLTREQIEKIIKYRGGGKLKTLDICFNASIREVPRSVLHLAEQKILEFSYLMH